MRSCVSYIFIQVDIQVAIIEPTDGRTDSSRWLTHLKFLQTHFIFIIGGLLYTSRDVLFRSDFAFNGEFYFPGCGY